MSSSSIADAKGILHTYAQLLTNNKKFFDRQFH